MTIQAVVPERIASRIEIDIESGCWLWQGARTDQGYGVVGWKGREEGVHRVVYRILVGSDRA